MNSLKLDAAVLDSPDVRLLTAFYQKLLGWQVDFIDEKTCARLSPPEGGTRILIQLNALYQRPVWPEREGLQQQQAHLDIEVKTQEEMQAAVRHALSLGAAMPETQFGRDEKNGTDSWVTLIDPVGHPFCFVIW